MFDFSGLVAAPVSPMTEAGKINLEVIKDYVEFLLQQGVKGVFVCGSTGEGPSLTVAERKLLTEKWIEHGRNRLDAVMIHCGSEQINNARELASHAESLKVDAVACIAPTYFKPRNLDALVAFLSEVAKAAPNTPFFYYHIPGMTGVEVNMAQFLDKATEMIPNFAGLKCSSSVLLDFKTCLDYKKKKLSVFYGGDEQLLGALAMGGTSAVGSTYNYLGIPNNRMLAAVSRGDLATGRKEQELTQNVVRVLFKYGGHNGVQKAIIQLCGLPVGPPRLPVLPLTASEVISLKNDLSSIGFFEARK